MMAPDNSALETDDVQNSTNIDTSPTKKKKRGKRTHRTHRSENTNGVMENGDIALSELIPPSSPKNTEIKKVNDSISEISTHSQVTKKNSDRNSSKVNQPLTPLQSSQSNKSNIENSHNYQQIELTPVTDDEDNEEREQRRNIQPVNHILSDHDTMVSSYTTGGDNDVIEIHEFSLADIDAYLDIYFETLNNRLSHFIGDNARLEQFRLAMKTRITSDSNAREYQNVLLGKMNDDVVAAVTLSFPGEPTTITNDNILPQSNSCFTSVRRWMTRNANYVPTNMEECYIEMIGVKSAHRNHGIGAAMLECVEHFARQAGALLLTVHTNGEQLTNYFQRFGFNVDHSDNSSFWKWAVERENITKMSKVIPPDDENTEYPMDNTSGYINESMVGSELE